jgi:hypothetical protein
LRTPVTNHTSETLGDQDATLGTDGGLTILAFDAPSQLNDVSTETRIRSDLDHQPLETNGLIGEYTGRNCTQNSSPTIDASLEKWDAVSPRSRAVV